MLTSQGFSAILLAEVKSLLQKSKKCVIICMVAEVTLVDVPVIPKAPEPRSLSSPPGFWLRPFLCPRETPEKRDPLRKGAVNVYL